jgi:hypothetical protein
MSVFTPLYVSFEIGNYAIQQKYVKRRTTVMCLSTQIVLPVELKKKEREGEMIDVNKRVERERKKMWKDTLKKNVKIEME